MRMNRLEVDWGPGGHGDVRFPTEVLSVRGVCGADPGELDTPVFLEQVHGASVLISPSSGERADGLVMLRGEGPPALKVADCLPAFLVSQRAVAAFHAGWRGLSAGIASRMMELFPGQPDMVVFGPSICPDCYEVGPEVRDAVIGGFPEEGHPPGRLDLAQAALHRLSRAGLDEDCPVRRIEECTRCSDGMFHSHRRDGTRQRNMLWMRSASRWGMVAGERA